MRSGEEIQAALRDFVSRWKSYDGSERGEAQTFLNELFECYGSDRKDVGAEFEDARSSAGIMDLHWRGVTIIEMKAPSQVGRLPEHRRQALNYWRHSADVATLREAPPYVVLCAFGRFEVWQPGKFPQAPRAEFTLSELPDRYESLLFLSGADDEPLFDIEHRELTQEAVQTMADLYHRLLARKAAREETIQAFILQMVWCLFAEDYGMLDGHPSQHLIEELIRQPYWTSYVMLGGLFDSLADPEDYGRQGVLAGTRHVNGQLFAQPAKVSLDRDELELLLDAGKYDWRNVEPTIFGSLMEKCLGAETRWELGAHYTHEADIMKIVRPTIVRPWRRRIDAAATPDEARKLLDELCAFRVLDPACGCGNFLYVAYRELRALEHELKQRITDVAKRTGLPAPADALPSYPLRNLQGIDIESISVHIAQVTLWMGHRQMIDRYGAAEPALPLVDLSTLRTGDALAVPWPETDCIVGNPPYHGSQHLRRARGDDYLTWLKQTFNVGIKDYCVYWFRKAQDHLGPGQRAGLVGTNSVAQNRARSASLDYVVEDGGVITDAVSTQDWPGEAAVDVSIVNWVKEPSEPVIHCELDGDPVSGITAELRTPERSTGEARLLPANEGRCFQGPIPVGDGFIIAADEAESLLSRADADYRQVVRPYLTGDDIAEDPRQQPRRWIIDFAQMPLEEAMRYPAALDVVRKRVKPWREENPRRSRRERWWLLGEQAAGMRQALEGLPRYVASTAQGKRLLVAWQEAWTCPSNLTYVFAFDDDYSMGLLAWFGHEAWARARPSTLEDRLRYTPTSMFGTWPWPYPVTDARRERVAEASRRVIARRQEICVGEDIGLTRLYNLVDEGAYADLKALHRELDEAVGAAYGWPKSVAQDADEIVRRLLQLNCDIAAGDRSYDPFATQAGQPVAETLDFG